MDPVTPVLTNKQRALEIRKITTRHHQTQLTQMNISVNNVLMNPRLLAIDVELTLIKGQFDNTFAFSTDDLETELNGIGYHVFAITVEYDEMRVNMSRNETAPYPLPTAIEYAMIGGALRYFNTVYTHLKGHPSIITEIKWWYDTKFPKEAGWYAQCNDGLGQMYMGKDSQEVIESIANRIFYLGRESGVDYQRGAGKPIVPGGPLDVSL